MILTGLARLGRDAELRYTPGGDAVTNLSLAWNYGKKDANGKQQTQWIDAAIFGKRAESLAPHLTKGTLLSVVIEDPHIEEWSKQDGSKGFKLAGRVSGIEFAGGGKREPSEGGSAPRPAPASNSGGAFDDMTDDIPF